MCVGFGGLTCRFPPLCFIAGSMLDLLLCVYEGFEEVLPAQWCEFYSKRAVVTPTNAAADSINVTMLDRLPTQCEKVSLSVDQACGEVALDDSYSPEFLHTLNSSGLPPHELRLRPGCLVILLRNYAPHKGMCNGTRLVIEKFYKHLLVVRVVTGPFRGCVEFLPRITCDSSGDSELPFALRRHQYPIKLAWAMTINKSQGQSISGRLGIFLPSPVFAHGQLYVAYSRGVSFQNVRLFVQDNGDSKQRVYLDESGKLCNIYTLNLVDRLLLAAARGPSSVASAHGSSASSVVPPSSTHDGHSVQQPTNETAPSLHPDVLRNPLACDENLCCEPSRPSYHISRIRRLTASDIERAILRAADDLPEGVESAA